MECGQDHQDGYDYRTHRKEEEIDIKDFRLYCSVWNLVSILGF